MKTKTTKKKTVLIKNEKPKVKIEKDVIKNYTFEDKGVTESYLHIGHADMKKILMRFFLETSDRLREEKGDNYAKALSVQIDSFAKELTAEKVKIQTFLYNYASPKEKSDWNDAAYKFGIKKHTPLKQQ